MIVGVLRAQPIGVPVVSVGNLTLGGTGKSPMVRWLARWFRQSGVSPAVVSRGYGSAAGEANDEALELRLLLPDVPHVQNPDRVAGGREAVEKYGAQLVLLDDGFQHRRIARDLDIVLLDALTPFGYGHVFPRGMLREPVSGLRRADAVVLSRADLIEPAEREAIWRVVRRYAPASICVEAAHCAAGVDLPAGAGKGDRHLLPERPFGCFAQKVPVPFSGANRFTQRRIYRGFLRPGQSGRISAYARTMRLPRRRFPRVPRPPSLHRRGRWNRSLDGPRSWRCGRLMHLQGPGENRPRPAGDHAASSGANRLGTAGRARGV